MAKAISRNDPCPCGSGLKYKKCCLPAGGVGSGRRSRIVQILVVVVVVAAGAVAVRWGGNAGWFTLGGGLLAVGAYLYIFTDPPSRSSGGNPGAINFGN